MSQAHAAGVFLKKSMAGIVGPAMRKHPGHAVEQFNG
jgi:hypothetical protein